MEISNTDRRIWSLDIIDELNELESMLIDHLADGFDEEDFYDIDDLKTLREWNAEGESATSDWEEGVELISDGDFKDYAKEYANEIYDIPESLIYYIDWESFADDLESDYTSIELSGKTYWVR